MYKASDGNFHPLKAKFPICLRGSIPGLFFLDTGGQLDQEIDFFMAKVEDGKLFRQDCEGEPWYQISSEVKFAGVKS